MLSGLEISRISKAITLHFTGKYDAVKYNFKTNIGLAAYEKSKTKWHFEKLARKGWTTAEVIDYFVGNALVDKTFVISCEEENLTAYQTAIEQLPYRMKQDMSKLLTEYGSLEAAVWTGLPKEMLGNRVSLVTGTGLFWQFGGTSKAVSPNIIRWPSLEDKINRLMPIMCMKLDYAYYQQIIGKAIVDHFTE